MSDYVPAYLRKYIHEIRGHNNENGYLIKRFADMSYDEMVNEIGLQGEMRKSGLMIAPENTCTRVFPATESHQRAFVHYPPYFVLTPRALNLWKESLLHVALTFLGGVVVTIIGSMLGQLILAKMLGN